MFDVCDVIVYLDFGDDDLSDVCGEDGVCVLVWLVLGVWCRDAAAARARILCVVV